MTVRASSGAAAFLLRQAPLRDVAATLALMAAASLTNGFGVLTLVPIIARLDGSAVADGLLGRIAAVVGFMPSTLALLCFVVVLAAVRAVIAYAQQVRAQQLEYAVVDGLRARAFAGVLHAEWRWLVQSRTSDHANLILTNVARVGQGLNQLLAALLIAIMAGGYLVVALLLSWQLAVVSATGGALVMAAFAAQRRRARQLGDAAGRTSKALHAHVQQGFAGVRISKAYGTEDRQADAFVAAMAAVRDQTIATQRMNGIGQGVLQVGGAAVLALMLGVGHLAWGMPLATLLPLLLVFSRLAPMLGSLQAAWSVWSFSQPAMVEMRTFLETVDAAREPYGTTSQPRIALTRAIELHDVGVQFAGRDVPALDGVTLTLPVNTTTALCGASGAGKSTLADVLMGLVAPDRGRLLIDGSPVTGERRIAWRRSIAYVQQDAFLFHDTIRANIALGRGGIDAPAVEQALRRAGADFALALPAGIDTVVGDGGVRLSGGERQRIALARALIGAPALLILDEATSALDPEHELAVRRTLRDLRGQVTLLFISHRESMREDADQVIVLERGRRM